jgi:cobalt-precorrin 5A hydrolase
MENRQTMIAVGLGCRAGCSVEDVVRAIATALASNDCPISQVHAFYTGHFKGDEAGLLAAAERLQRPLILLSFEQLKAQTDRILTPSTKVMAELQLPAVAEAAALAGAEMSFACARVRLLGPRQIAGGATCALAVVERPQ